MPSHLDQQICSTGFCVLRVKRDTLVPEYLFFWVQNPVFVQTLIVRARGIGFPAVSDTDVKQSQIPVPPLSEQRRIAAILREADELRRLRRQANVRARDLLPALFQEMFEGKDKHWPVHRLGKIIDRLEPGRSIAAEAEPATPAEWGILKVSAVTYGIFRAEENKRLHDDFSPSLQLEVRDDDLLISRANTYELIGASAIVRNTQPYLIIPDKLWRVILPSKPETNVYFFVLSSQHTRYATSYKRAGNWY